MDPALRKFELICSDVHITEDNIIRQRWKLAQYNDLDQMIEHMDNLKYVRLVMGGKGKYLFLSDIRAMKSISREAREALANSPILERLCKAHAIIGDSALAKMIGALFIKNNKPLYTTKLFSDYDEGVAWLLEQA